MARPKKESESSRTRRRPARSPEARENQLISAATDLAEKQILAGTASATVITHYLKLGSMREQLEREKLREENKLLRAKVESLASAQTMEETYKKALDAMRLYSGKGDDEDYDDR